MKNTYYKTLNLNCLLEMELSSIRDSKEIYVQREKEKATLFELNKVITILKNVIISFFDIAKLKKNKNIFFTSSEGRYKKTDLFYDKYTDNIISPFINDFLLFESPTSQLKYLHSGKERFRKQIIYFDLFYVFERVFLFFLKRKYQVFINNEFIDKGNVIGDLDLEIKKLIKNRMIQSLCRYDCLSILFKYIKPNTVSFFCSYAPKHRVLISVLKNYNIPSYEFQHGHIYEKHFGYNYLNSFCKQYQPDKLFIFNEYYRTKLIKMGWRLDNLTVVGNFLTTKMNLAQSLIDKDKYQFVITVINQYTLTNEIVDFLNDFSLINKNCLFLLKLHPRLINSQIEIIKLKLKGNLTNIKVVSEGTFNECLAQSDAVIGAYSSGLIDALNYGIKYVFLIKEIIQSNYYLDLVDNKILSFISKNTELSNYIKSLEPNLLLDGFALKFDHEKLKSYFIKKNEY